MPGQANTTSMATDPLSSPARVSPEKVRTGMTEFFMACLKMTIRSDSPLMRANLTYSLSMTSSILDRASRSTPAMLCQDRTKAGRMKCSIPPRP